MPEDTETTKDSLFFKQKEEAVMASISDESNRDFGNDESPDDKITAKVSKEETALYWARVNNMRMQFAWTAVVLALIWVFIIIYIILSHAIGCLYLLPLYRITWGIATMVTTSTVAYSGFMVAYVISNNILWRRLAPHIALPLGPLAGIATYLWIPGDKLGIPYLPFTQLSDGVLIALITTTTISVLGILSAVMFWLFPRSQKNVDL